MNVEGIAENGREVFCKEGRKNMRKLREAEERENKQETEKVGQQDSDSCVKGLGL